MSSALAPRPPLPHEARQELRWTSGIHLRPGKETDSCCEHTAPSHRAGEAMVCDRVRRAVGTQASCLVPRGAPGSASALTHKVQSLWPKPDSRLPLDGKGTGEGGGGPGAGR